eukprot:6946145-Pyramimonas_sp.AAC.2
MVEHAVEPQCTSFRKRSKIGESTQGVSLPHVSLTHVLRCAVPNPRPPSRLVLLSNWNSSYFTRI